MTSKEIEFEAKVTNAKVYRMNKLDKKRCFQRKLLIISYFVALFLVLITCVVGQSWQILFYCNFGVICLLGLISEQIYEKRRAEILKSFVGPDYL